jgi:hypothetical protein
MIARLCYWLSMRLIARREPDQIIYRNTGRYLVRWWVLGRTWDHNKQNYVPRRVFGYTWYLHCFVQSDDDRAMHDHPWRWWSFVLRNSYYEYRGDPSFANCRLWHQGDFRSGQATDIHRIELMRNARQEEIPVWTWFFIGPWERDWGFWCNGQWKWWREFDRDGGC